MKTTEDSLRTEYHEALRAYLACGGEEALHRAYGAGRRAMEESRGILDIIALHHEALDRLGREGTRAQWGAPDLQAAGEFLTESLSSFEMTHRVSRETTGILRRLNEVLEEEARRIAHALHDDAGQLLACVHYALEKVSREASVRTRTRLGEVRGLLQEIDSHLRRLSHELRPTILDDLGLVPALDFLAQGYSTRNSLAVSVIGARDIRFPPEIETALYRVVQEALRNASRHGNARNISIRVGEEEGSLLCSVRDDGMGFDPVKAMRGDNGGGLGLIGIRERVSTLGGTVRIDSSPGHGSTLNVHIPLETDHADSSAPCG